MDQIVILACMKSEKSDALVKEFSEEGLHVIGPASRASHALALAAQSPVKLAVVGYELAGRRNGAQLADDLLVNWGVQSLLLEESISDEGGPRDHPMVKKVRGVLSQSVHV